MHLHIITIRIHIPAVVNMISEEDKPLNFMITGVEPMANHTIMTTLVIEVTIIGIITMEVGDIVMITIIVKGNRIVSDKIILIIREVVVTEAEVLEEDEEEEMTSINRVQNHFQISVSLQTWREINKTITIKKMVMNEII